MKKLLNKQVYHLANYVKGYVEKNYEAPQKAQYGDTVLNAKEMVYALCYVINHLTEDVAIPTIGTNNQRSKPINIKVYQKDYKILAQRVVKYIKSEGKISTCLVYGDYEIGLPVYLYAFARILAYYDTHKTLPSYVLVDSNAFVKPSKHGHATKSGCDNRGQNNGYYCGCHSLQEVFRNLTGIVVPQSTIAEWAGTTTSGTDHDGLNTAVAAFNKKYNKKLRVEWKNLSDLGWNGIKAIINSNNQDCIIHNLYRNQWGHYEVINKVYKDYCDVQNSLGDYCNNGCYCGYVEERTFSTFNSYISGISQKSVMVITNG